MENKTMNIIANTHLRAFLSASRQSFWVKYGIVTLWDTHERRQIEYAMSPPLRSLKI